MRVGISSSWTVGLTVVSWVAWSAGAHAGAADLRIGGLSTPECVLHDTGADVYLVSNIVGSPVEKDGKGFISRVTPDGKVLALKWIDGDAHGVTLNAPKGMAIAAGTLYVSDIDVVRVFDGETGAPKGEVPVPGAVFLNDVATAPGGGVYVTDSGLVAGESGLGPSGRSALHHVLADGTVQTLIKKDKLPALNGVAAFGERILLVAFDSNELLEAKEGALTTLAKLPTGALDGLVQLPDGRWAASSWEGKAVYAGPLGGPFETLIADVPSPADIGIDRKRARLLVPVFTEDQAVVYAIPK